MSPIWCPKPFHIWGLHIHLRLFSLMLLLIITPPRFHLLRQWHVLINPLKVANTPEETKFSKWMESVRKDVECLFCQVKGRFRILKLAFLFRDKGDIDNVWFT